MSAEIEYAINKMGKYKTPGPDDQTIEMWRALETEKIKLLTKIANKIYNTGNIPEDMTKSIFIAIPKKINASNCEDYRTISLISHTLKIISRVVLERIRNKTKI